MTRLKYLASAAAISVLSFNTAAAAPVDQQGAEKLKKDLLSSQYVAPSVKDSVTVQPDGSRYKITYDFERFFKKLTLPNLTLDEVQPFISFATPRDDGRWLIEADNKLSFKGKFSPPGKPATDFTANVDSSSANALFDPALHYIRNGTFKLQDLGVNLAEADKRTAFKIAGINYGIDVNDTADGSAQALKTTGSMSDMVAEVTQPGQASFTMKAQSAEFSSLFDGIKLRVINEISSAISAKSEKPAEMQQEIKEELPKAFPLLQSYKQDFTLKNVSFSTADQSLGEVSALSYGASLDGAPEAMRIGFSIRSDGASVDSAILPPAYAGFVPQSLNVEVAMPNLNFDAFWQEFKKQDWKQKGDQASAAGDREFRAMLPDGRLLVEFPNVSAVSDSYDFQISGTFSGRFLNEKAEDVVVKATILARDIDKTIAAVQAAAQQDPRANNVSMGLMMAKGFAKTDPDGRSRWEVVAQPDGSVSVNGQQLKGPDTPAKQN
ncbi:hypothetical protein [Oryzifoliimicrobium ureilyticus]|uniref:hypothetical protein n=1 Tax=Oryzifoliimicrobium ureilyticus TaxID=3113724 RepID=UPI0030767F6D